MLRDARTGSCLPYLTFFGAVVSQPASGACPEGMLAFLDEFTLAGLQ